MIVRRTEYKEIVFDSKSEAVFARTLDLAGIQWEYHPQTDGIHEWDFMAVDARGVETLVEYKPAMPTETYIDWITNTMRCNPKESIIVWGSPWDIEEKQRSEFSECCYVVYPIFSSFSKHGWGDFILHLDNGEDGAYSYRHDIGRMFGVTREHCNHAKSFRFDLRRQANANA